MRPVQRCVTRWVTVQFNVGLVQSRRYKYAGVSCDAIAVVKDGPQLLIATVEVKTKTTVATVGAALERLRTAREMMATSPGAAEATVFMVHAASRMFNVLVEPEFRHQVIHQMCVTGTLIGCDVL